MKYCIFLFFGCFCFCLTAQQDNKSIKGVLISSLDGKPVPYAHVYLKGERGGVVSNYDGAFSYQFVSNVKDTLCISHVSFNDTAFIIGGIQNDSLVIQLVPKEFQLSEVTVVSEDSLAKIVSGIKKNFRQNYPTSIHYLGAFYREVTYDAQCNCAGRLIEATVGIQDKGYGTTMDNIKCEMIALRKSDDQSNSKSSLWIKAVKKFFPETENNFFNLIKSNPLRRYRLTSKKEESDFFGKNLVATILDRGDLSLTGTLIDSKGNSTLLLSFEKKGIYSFKGEMVVDANNYSIISWSHQVISNGSVLEAFKYMYTLSDKCSYPYFYRSIDNNYVGNDLNSYSVQTILFTEYAIYSKDITRIKKRNMLSDKGDFYKNKGDYDAEYWENQNVLLEEPLDIKDVENLSHGTDLERQFVKNSSNNE